MMSVVCQSDAGWVICHRSYINNVYANTSFANAASTIPNTSTLKDLKLRSIFFKIRTPFRHFPEEDNTSRAEKSLRRSTSNKRKKRKLTEADGEDDNEEIQEIIRNAMTELVSRALEVGYLSQGGPSEEEWMENNRVARQAYQHFRLTTKNLIPHSCYGHSPSTKSDCYMNNDDKHAVISSVGVETYVIPPQSSCILGDLSCLQTFVQKGVKFECIIMDPPWHNKSAKRLKTYEWLRDEDLLEVPIQELAKPGCVIAIWTTNNPTQNKFVKEMMFPKWSVEHLGDWHWLKVTCYGQPVCPLGDPHKKPYENLILGYIRGDKQAGSHLIKSIQNHKVFISIPSIIHSHKPPISEILKPYLSPNTKCLELFARYLLPNFTSFGKEVLVLQNMKLFDQEMPVTS